MPLMIRDIGADEPLSAHLALEALGERIPLPVIDGLRDQRAHWVIGPRQVPVEVHAVGGRPACGGDDYRLYSLRLPGCWAFHQPPEARLEDLHARLATADLAGLIANAQADGDTLALRELLQAAVESARIVERVGGGRNGLDQARHERTVGEHAN